jgi:predicted transcriptional regulator
VRINLPDALLRDLDALASRTGVSRASLIREAVTQYLAQHGVALRQAVFGLWRDRDDDGLTYQTRLRDQWSGR